MLEQLLPTEVAAVETFADRLDIALFAEEHAVLARARAKRRNEFTSVRACARDALSRIGVAPVPLVPGEQGAPGWPRGVVGSMTHCEGYRGAAVAHDTDVDSIGIDAEPDAPLGDGVLDMITVPADLAGVAAVGRTGVAGDRLLFSAKEAVYKAWYPLARRWLGFDDVTLELRADGTFTARVLIDAVLADGRVMEHLDGRWVATRGLVVTAVVVPGPEQVRAHGPRAVKRAT